MKKLLVRLQNKTILTAVISGIMLILLNLGVIDVEMSHKADVIINTVLGMLVAIGVVKNPESHVKE
ncbi:phage holin [Bacillus amyloliquefaciens]|uniref:phage holin n=1 Tax=Bacillus amyloliquefaciens TaxID=1390 RepID=UPI0005ED7A40|nr:phage holin [Bacillus amyloliquefaciens]